MKATKEILTERQLENIAHAAQLIVGNFSWKKSVQGHDYWDEVYNNLMVLKNLRIGKENNNKKKRKKKK